MKRKRAPGGGRKARSGPTSPLTFRIPAELRKRLETEAAAKDATVSERLLWHLKRSLDREIELNRDEATRAFCFLIFELSDRLRWGAGPPPVYWERNPFVFKAFKLAVEKLLSSFEPKGEIKRPPVEEYLKEAFSQYQGIQPPWLDAVTKEWESPERAADSAVRNTVLDLAGMSSPGAIRQYFADREPALSDPKVSDMASRHIKRADQTWDGMADVRRVLGVNVQIEKPGGKRK